MNSIKLGDQALHGRNILSCSLTMESNIDMNEYLIDLPNLESITSELASFNQPRIITLSSNILND